MKEGWNTGGAARGIAWLETVAIQLGLLMLLELNFINQESNYIVWTDNTITESALKSKKSKGPFVNEEWKVIQTLLIGQELDITPKRVTSEVSIANVLLRGIQYPHMKENRVWLNIPPNLIQFLFHA
jgi:hypothetical protein